LPLNNHFCNVADFFNVMPIIFDVLPISLSQSRFLYRKADCFIAKLIVFVSNPIILRLGKASPVPSWLFSELAARSHHFYFGKFTNRPNESSNTIKTVNVLYKIRQELFYNK
jgi:hypothetical protein